MKYIIFSLLYFNLLFGDSGIKPTDFSIVIHKPFKQSLQSVTQDYDGDISAVGFLKTYKPKNTSHFTYNNPFDFLASKSNLYGAKIALIKIDKNGNIIFDKVMQLKKFNKAVSIIKTPQNGYFIGGYTLNGSEIILKLDSNGRTIFTKIFGTANQDKMERLIHLRDGGVLAIGTSTTSREAKDNLFESGLGLNDVMVTRFSQDGQQLWNKRFGTELDDIAIDGVEAYDGSIILVSTTKTYKTAYLTLMRISQNGDKLWSLDYQKNEEIIPKKILALRNNSFLLSSVQKDELGVEQIRLINFDLQKNIIIDKVINTTYSSGLNDLVEFSNGNVMGVGYVKDTYDADGLVIVLNSELSLINQEHYGANNYDLFNALCVLKNSQAIAVGLFTQPKLQTSDMWIVKLNQDGTIAQKALQSIEFYKRLKMLFKDEIAQGLLEIKKDLSINLLSKDLYFKVGSYHLTKVQEKFLNRFSKKLIPFLAKNRKIIKSFEINGHTSTEWGKDKFTNRYLKNAKLSINRAYCVLRYIFKTQNIKNQKVLSKFLRSSGFSYSKIVKTNNQENKIKSRRVSFKIILGEEK